MSEDEAHSLKLRIDAAEAAYPEELSPTNRNNPHLAFKCIDEIAHHPVIIDADLRSQISSVPIFFYTAVCFFSKSREVRIMSAGTRMVLTWELNRILL